MVIPPAVRSALVEHAEAEKPNEACGLIALRDGVAERYLPGRNRDQSPYRFDLDIDPEAWFLEDDGYELAVFHSHLSRWNSSTTLTIRCRSKCAPARDLPILIERCAISTDHRLGTTGRKPAGDWPSTRHSVFSWC